MIYSLKPASTKHIPTLIKYKMDTILKYAKNIQKEELEKITNYVNISIPKQLSNYKLIVVENKEVGCLLVREYKEGVLLDEIYIEEAYRNMNIGTTIIKEIINNNKTIYLYVYKDNIKACELYKRLGFKIIEESESRYFMQYKNQ